MGKRTKRKLSFKRRSCFLSKIGLCPRHGFSLNHDLDGTSKTHTKTHTNHLYDERAV